MSATRETDWNPGTYHRFRGHRLQPALDLLARIGPLPEGEIVDLGCGAGDVAAPLRARFIGAGNGRRLVGVDHSPAMLEAARQSGAYDLIAEADIAAWQPDEPPALIFSNAVLQWLPDHAALLPRLVGDLRPGGVLAVQVPHQNNAPSHRLWHALAEEFFPGQLRDVALPGVQQAAQYHHLLAPLGEVALWETEYYQLLPASADGHPVRRFTEATFARPILTVLDGSQQARVIRAYEDVIGKAYPSNADGSVLFPFRRMFFTVQKRRP